MGLWPKNIATGQEKQAVSVKGNGVQDQQLIKDEAYSEE